MRKATAIELHCYSISSSFVLKFQEIVYISRSLSNLSLVGSIRKWYNNYVTSAEHKIVSYCHLLTAPNKGISRVVQVFLTTTVITRFFSNNLPLILNCRNINIDYINITYININCYVTGLAELQYSTCTPVHNKIESIWSPIKVGCWKLTES